MKNSYYPTTTPKIVVFVVTILLFIWTIIDSNLIHLGGLAFASLVMLMFHLQKYIFLTMFLLLLIIKEL